MSTVKVTTIAIPGEIHATIKKLAVDLDTTFLKLANQAFADLLDKYAHMGRQK